jgi:DNA-binding NtrC family response regulator
MDDEILTLAEIERRAILASIRRQCGNRMAAARELGVTDHLIRKRLAKYEAMGDFVPKAVYGCPKYVPLSVATNRS